MVVPYEEDKLPPMTIVEVIAELKHGGYSLGEIAGYDSTQFREVICRERDEVGRLKRHWTGLPQWVEDTTDADGQRRVGKRHAVPFAMMYRQVERGRGKSRDETEESWRKYVFKARTEILGHAAGVGRK